MKTLNKALFVLLVIGGLNWGLYGLFGFDLIATIFGELTILSRLVYILIAIAAVYEITQFEPIRRWRETRSQKPTHA